MKREDLQTLYNINIGLNAALDAVAEAAGIIRQLKQAVDHVAKQLDLELQIFEQKRAKREESKK